MKLVLTLAAIAWLLTSCASAPEQCEPATGVGQCNLPPDEQACVCGWPPFWER